MILLKNNYEENEKLFSTGNSELDDILQEVYYSGLEDGYDYAQKEFAQAQDSEKKPNNKGLNAGLAVAGTTAAAGTGLAGYSIAKTKKNFKNFLANDAKAAELAKSGNLKLSRIGTIKGAGCAQNGGIDKAMEFAKNNKRLYKVGGAGLLTAGAGLLATGGLLAAKKIKNNKAKKNNSEG